MKTIIIVLAVAFSGYANAQPMGEKSTHQLPINQSIPQTMEAQSMKVVQEFLTAIQTHNGEKMVSLLHPAIKWHQPGKNRFAGPKSSRDEVLQMAGGMQEVAEKTLTLTRVKTLSANGNQVACLVHWKAVQQNGGILDVDNIDVYTVENGQIVDATVFSADLAQEDNFWLK